MYVVRYKYTKAGKPLEGIQGRFDTEAEAKDAEAACKKWFKEQERCQVQTKVAFEKPPRKTKRVVAEVLDDEAEAEEVPSDRGPSRQAVKAKAAKKKAEQEAEAEAVA